MGHGNIWLFSGFLIWLYSKHIQMIPGYVIDFPHPCPLLLFMKSNPRLTNRRTVLLVCLTGKVTRTSNVFVACINQQKLVKTQESFKRSLDVKNSIQIPSITWKIKMEMDFHIHTYLQKYICSYTLKYFLSMWSAAGHLYNKTAKQMTRIYFEFILPKAKSKKIIIVQLNYLRTCLAAEQWSS